MSTENEPQGVFKRYWVSANDELPGIGTGIRTIEADVGDVWVRVRSYSTEPGSEYIRLVRRVWDAMPHIPHNRDMPWKSVLASLRHYNDGGATTCPLKTPA